MDGKKLPRRNAIPILYTRGTHYEVGFDVGRTFAYIIKNFLSIYEPMNEYLTLYNTPAGKQVYNETLESVKKSFPQYVRELEGVADGAQVEFYKIFLLHLDDILPQALAEKEGCQKQCEAQCKQPVGCSTILINEENYQLLGHTEDALTETLNHFYYVDAHIICDCPQGRYNVKEEKFFSLCYAGNLPGYTMSYNHHGLVFSINTIAATHLRSGKTPRTFLTRALLAAENYNQAEMILRDCGVGAADACTINMIFLGNSRKDRIFYNIEIGPAVGNNKESQLDIKSVPLGNYNYHTNRYERLSASQCNKFMKDSSDNRMSTFCKYSAPKTLDDLIQMLGDNSNPPHTVFVENGDLSQMVKTIVVGIFDLQKKTLTLYSDNPRNNKPLTILPIQLKEVQEVCQKYSDNPQNRTAVLPNHLKEVQRVCRK